MLVYAILGYMIDTVQLSPTVNIIKTINEALDWLAPINYKEYDQELELIEQIELENKLMQEA